ncbi:MAG TPA: hypothetical protein VGZ29_08855 [Terriglobia bacterium]|nr:hypothetical protein [Terriglobia bacterium]
MPKRPVKTPFCFVSYSTREPHVEALIECIEIVMSPHFNVVRTPSALQSGASQRDQITTLIKESSFGIVVLDGLRPNVVFEYGIMHGLGKPVILLKAENARVDLTSFLSDSLDLKIAPVKLDIDQQFSDVKDVYYGEWRRFEVKGTVRRVLEEYRKKKDEITGWVEIQEPRL